MDEKELQAVSEALDQLRKGSTVSAETLAKLGGTTQNVNKALEGYTKRLLGATSAVGSMARSIEDGGGSFKSMSGAIQGVANGLGKIAGLAPGIGGALKALTGALGEAAGYVLERMDDITKNYQSLGDASATAADGFDGLLRQFNQMGNYSLPAFTKAVKANTAGLAALGGNAAMGAEQLSKVAGALTTKDTAKQFLKLGISLDAVGDATAGYLADYARAGLLQGATTEQLTKKTQDYIIEVDKIARLTGQTRAQQEEERRKSMANAQFRAQLAQMNASGQQESAASLKTFANAIGGPAADAIRAYATGIPLTKQAAEADLFTQGKLREITMKVRDGQLSAAQGIVELQDALGQGVNTFGQLTAYGSDLGGVFVQAADQQAILNEQNKTAAERLADAEATTKKLMNSESDLTEKFVDANLATAGVAKNIQSLGFSLASLAVGPVKRFATALENVTGFVDKRFGIGGKYSTPAGVDRGAAGGPRSMSSGPGDRQALLNLIGQGESGGDYNALVGGGRADLTGMTIAQVQEFQKNMRAAGRPSTAVGKYQMIASTLAEQAKKAGLDPTTTKFDEKTQDLLAQQLISQAGYGRKDPATVMRNLAGTWAALPQDMSGRGRYDGYNTNKANVDPNQLMAAIAGPSGRYNSPVKDVPAPTAGADTKIQGDRTTEQQQQASQTGQLTRQLAELNQTQRDLLAVNKKILQRQG